jgi:MSHA biogenesis protein MshL
MSIHGGDTMAKIGILVAACLLCFACATVEPPKEAPKLVKPVDIPSPVLPQVEKEKKIEIEGPKELFSFSLREADLKDVLRGIAKQANYNVVVEPDVKGTSTVDLKNVTLPKALEYILEPLNYGYKLEDRTIYVSRPKVETRVFQFNYVTFIKKGKSLVKGSSGTDRSGEQATGITLETGTENDVWKGVEDSLKTLLSAEGKLTFNKQAALIAVTDYPKNLKNIAGFLQSVESSVQRQIMIEARIIEVQLNDKNQEGVNWSFIEGKIGSLIFNFEQQLQIIDPRAAVQSGLQSVKLFVGGPHLDIQKSFIDLLKTQGTLNYLSNPKVSTLNNQRAVIKVATDDAVFESTTTPSAIGQPTVSTTIKYITIGLVLDVVPHVDDKGNITMNIHPMLTERTGEDAVDRQTGNRVPILAVREVDTTVRVREGEMVVIGGLIREFKRNQYAATPGLSGVPLLGWAFRSKVDEVQRSELVIFLTPKVVYAKDPV